MYSSIIKDHSVAPYNFVSLPKRCVFPYENYRELPGHDVLDASYLNGYIEYEMENETPLIPGKDMGKEEKVITPFKNPKGKYAVPGNTIRGILRNNTAFLSLSSLEDFIDDSRFYFRSFGTGKSRKDYSDRLDIGTKNVGEESLLMPKNINGGYIYKDSNDKYVIVPSKKTGNNDLSYFVIREQYLRRMHPDVDGINYMYNDKILDLITNRNKYKSNGHNMSRNKKNLLKNNTIKYTPYCVEISFEIKNVRTISKIGKPGEYKYNGYLMSSEHIFGKQVHYVIPEPDFESPDIVPISKDDGSFKFIDFYKDDLLRTKKQREPDKINEGDRIYFFLPDKEGKELGKPIFYGKFKNEDKIYFGFSPYLRIPYDYSVKDCMPEGYKDKSGLSYVDALFGFTQKGKEKLNYKGRLSFEDAVCTDESPKLDKEYTLVAGQPHATAYQSYLKQSMNYTPEEIKNYNDSDSEIRGIKEYLNKDYCDSVEDAKENVSVHIRPLAKNTTFKGRIYFKNLKREELGLVLWALKVKDGAFETIGYGKPYGFGRVNIKNIKVKTEDIYKKYSSMTADYYREENREKFISEYKKNFKEKFNIDIDAQASVREFIILKTMVFDSTHKNDARYMKIQFSKEDRTNEFNMLKPLPDPEELQKIVDGKYTLYRNTSPNESNKNDNRKKNTRNKSGKPKSYYDKNKFDSSSNFNNSMSDQLKKWKDKNNKRGN